MPHYLVVAHQTATSSELLVRLRELAAGDAAAMFSLLIPETLPSQLLVDEQGAARETGQAARALLEAAGLRVEGAIVGDSSPMLAIEDELRAHEGRYNVIVLATLPPGISRWLRMDIHSQVARRFDVPVISVTAQPASMPEVPSLARYTVAEVMHSDVAIVGADRPMEELITDISDVQYGCFVVVDTDQAPVGIITEGDIIRLALAEQIPGGAYLREILSSVEAGARYVQGRRTHTDTVADFMTTPVVTVPVDERLQRVAETFAESDFHRLPVVQDGALAGLIRRIDLMGPILQVHEEIQQQRRTDASAP